MSQRLPRFAGLFSVLVAGISSLSAQNVGSVTPTTTKVPVLTLPTLPHGTAKRRVYLLHSGVNTISSVARRNDFGETMRVSLLKRGVSIKDIVVLDSPYPRATWYNMFPRECLTLFMASAKPDSPFSLASYQRLDKALKAYAVTSQDDLVWIGHSAGGQMGLTMAYLACQHDKIAELADITQPYHFDSVITLGSPISSNYLPPEVKVRHYVSPQDVIPRRLARLSPPFLWLCGYDLPINMLPATLTPGSKIRVFFNVEHPYWDTTERVVDRILAETNPHYRPTWQTLFCQSCTPLAMAPFLCQALDEFCDITFEDPARGK